MLKCEEKAIVASEKCMCNINEATKGKMCFEGAVSDPCAEKSINLLSASCKCGNDRSPVDVPYGQACVGEDVTATACTEANITKAACYCGN